MTANTTGSAMTGRTDKGGARQWSRLKIAVWAAPALLMLLALINNGISDEEGWSGSDFVFAAVLFYGALGLFEGMARMIPSLFYRAGAGVGIAALVLLLWGNGALGITDTDADGWYLGVLVVGVIGPLFARLRAHGMAVAMMAGSIAMVLVSGLALAAGKVGPNNSGFQILAITGFYAALFAGSAGLFWSAAREGSGRRAA